MTSSYIPLQLPYITEDERRSVAEAIASGQISGNGPICKRIEEEIADAFGCRHVLLTTSCTHALELAALCLDLGADDEVIMPSFTFSSTANAFLLRNAKPVFAEISPTTFNLNPEDVRRRITPRTRAIVLVHYAGMPCDMAEFIEIAEYYRLVLIEDAAQAVDSKWCNQYLGTIGDIGCFSFHSTKNITCGEGGAFLTNNDRIAARAEVIREKGTNRHAFLRGEVDRYSWVAPGSSYVLSDLLAAVLHVQFQNRSKIKALRKAIWSRYLDALQQVQARHSLTLPAVPPDADPNYHLFAFLVDRPDRRDRVLQLLRDKDIGATFHFVPLHSAQCSAESGVPVPDLPITTSVSERLIRLPLYPGLSDEGVSRVICAVSESLEAT
jgi:dTDP-4-amino-4,6-dideoxygalactose transaminase